MPTVVLTLSERYSPEKTRLIVNEVVSITDTVLQKPLGRKALILRHVD